MLDPFSIDPKRDLPEDRQLFTENGNSYHIARKPENPYGFWTIHMDKGQVPEELKGQYTSPKFAEQAIQSYLQKKNKCLVKPPSKSKTTSEVDLSPKPRA